MERRWLVSVLAAVAVSTAPALADEAAPGAEQSPPPEKQSAPETRKPEPVQVALGTAQPMPAQPMPAPPAPRFTYGGSADFYYSTNFNDPWTGTNGLSVFDFKDERGPHLSLIDLWAQYSREGGVGGRIDLMWGPTGRIVNFGERPISGDDFWDHVEQLYVSVNLNKKGTTYLDFGRWVTPAGAEVIESKDNWLFSRGILFGYAIPFTHFGARAYHYFNDTDYVMAHINRGWDVVSDPGHGLGFGLTGAKALNQKWTLIGNYIGGNEFNRMGRSGYRNLFDVVALYNANDRWAYTFNFDLGTQSGDTWFGIATQAKYTIDPKSYAAARLEFLTDDSGFRIGSDTTAFGVTLNYTYLWSKYLQTRAEFRYDFAGDDLFPDSRRGTFTDNQPRFIIAAIASYN
jgi:hypothetical protein